MPMKVVFVCGPFRGKTPWGVECNVHRAEAVAFRVAQEGAVPLCPHTMYRHFDGTLTDAFWLAGARELLRRSDAVVLAQGWQESEGSRGEYAEALEREMPIFRGADARVDPSPVPEFMWFGEWLHRGVPIPGKTLRAMAAYVDKLASDCAYEAVCAAGD